MSNDDWSTINLRGGRDRNLRALRHRYEQHRSALRQLEEGAPSETLAKRYHELQSEIDRALSQLDSLDPLSADLTSGARPAGPPPSELSSTVPRWNGRSPEEETGPMTRRPAGSRTFLMVLLAVLLIVILGGIIYWTTGPSSPEEESAAALVAEPATASETTAREPEPEPAKLAIQPDHHDFGAVKKGTRTVAGFTLTNMTDQPLRIAIDRSNCRCLWYDYPASIPAHESVPLQISIDGARADQGPVEETVRIFSKSDDAFSAEVKITGEIR